MESSDKSLIEKKLGELIKNTYKYFKTVDKLKGKYSDLKKELSLIRDELVEIRDLISEYRKVEDEKRD